MSEYIEVGQPLQFTDPNTPTRVGEIVENVGDIYNIPSPRVGMRVFVKSEKKSYVITSLKSKVVNGLSVPNAQVEAFRCVEDEIIDRIQGRSENSDAVKDPFKFIGNFDGFEALIEKLDTMHNVEGVTGSSVHNGHFRALVGSKLVDIVNEAQGYAYDVWSQRITCAGIVLRNDVVKTETSYSDFSDDAGHKYRQRRYVQKFVDAVSGSAGFDVKGSVKTFCRRHHLTGDDISTWTPWYDVENPYVQTQNYGKKIALFGASFAQNMAVSGYEFTHEGTSYKLADYIAEKLGAVAFDDYAVGGQGMRCDDNSPFPVHLMNQLKTAQSKGIYDIYIIMGGVNDYWCDKVPLGESTGYASGSSDDEEQNISYCGGLLKAIDYIRVNAPNAKIYTITPFKGYNAEWGWNPRTKIRNAYGNSFYEFVQAQKEVSQVKGVPCLDLWAMQGFSGANATEHYISDLLHPNGNGYYKASEKIVEFVAHGVGSEVVDVQALSTPLDIKITAEIQRAKDAEQANADAINAEKERAKQAEQANRQLIADLVGESPETLDTIHEISSWILNDETGAAAMAKEINENKNAIAKEVQRAEEIAGNLDALALDVVGLQTDIPNIQNQAARFDGNTFSATANEVKLTTTGVNISKQWTVSLPTATTKSAGVISAEDKEKLNRTAPVSQQMAISRCSINIEGSNVIIGNGMLYIYNNGVEYPINIAEPITYNIDNNSALVYNVKARQLKTVSRGAITNDDIVLFAYDNVAKIRSGVLFPAVMYDENRKSFENVDNEIEKKQFDISFCNKLLGSALNSEILKKGLSWSDLGNKVASTTTLGIFVNIYISKTYSISLNDKYEYEILYRKKNSNVYERTYIWNVGTTIISDNRREKYDVARVRFRLVGNSYPIYEDVINDLDLIITPLELVDVDDVYNAIETTRESVSESRLNFLNSKKNVNANTIIFDRPVVGDKIYVEAKLTGTVGAIGVFDSAGKRTALICTKEGGTAGDVISGTYEFKSGDATIKTLWDKLDIVDVRYIDAYTNKLASSVYVADMKSTSINASLANNIKPIMHGGTSVYPQNNLELYRLAGRNGVLFWECDVRPCLDGFVLSHDDDMYQLAVADDGSAINQGDFVCSQKTIAELKTLKVGVKKGTTSLVSGFEDERIPTLEEFLTLCKIYGACPILELKFYAPSRAEDLYNIVKKMGMLNKTIWLLYSGRNEWGNALHALDDRNNIVYCGDTSLPTSDIDEIISFKTEKNIVGLYYYISTLTDEIIDRALTNEVMVGTWSGTSINNWSSLLQKGYSMFSLDNPASNPLIELR